MILLFRHDAHHYLQLTRGQYAYDAANQSNVAFFPAYPLLCKFVASFGIPPAYATLVASNAALLVAFLLLAHYTRIRWPDSTPRQRLVVLALFGFWPMGVFFHMPYSESLFAACSLAVLLGMARHWPLVVIALLAGLTTAARPVGLALSLAVLVYAWQLPGRRGAFRLARVAVVAPLAGWGLIAYMGYQWAEFGDPLAFAKTQQYWVLNVPADRTLSSKAWSLFTLEPVWGIFLPDSPRHWSQWGGNPAWTGLTCWNPAFFVLAAVLVWVGHRRNWLTLPEAVAGALLLAIPYCTRAYEMSMASHARFASVVMVQYLVAGRLLAGRPKLALAVCAASACLQAFFAAMYARNYWVF